MYAIYGTYENSIGLMLGGYFSKLADCGVYAPFSAIGWVKNDKISGVALFTNFSGSNVDIHVQAFRCMTKKSILDVYDYAFNKLKCNKITAKPYANNEKLSSLLPRLGFNYICKLDAEYGDLNNPIDANLFILKRETALNWLRCNAKYPKTA